MKWFCYDAAAKDTVKCDGVLECPEWWTELWVYNDWENCKALRMESY